MNNTYTHSSNTLVKRGITIQQFFDFVKKSDKEVPSDFMSLEPDTVYYLNKFTKYGHRQFFLSLNIPVLCFSMVWLSYRKIYSVLILQLLSSLCFVLSSIIYLKPNLFSNDIVVQQGSLYMVGLILFVLFVITNVFLSLSANAIYLSHVRRCILKGKYHKKGVSKTGAIVATIVSVTLIALQIPFYLENNAIGKQILQMISKKPTR